MPSAVVGGDISAKEGMTRAFFVRPLWWPPQPAQQRAGVAAEDSSEVLTGL